MLVRRIFVRAWVALLVSMLACFSNAFATPVIWTLSNVTFTGGGTASGYFVYDADTLLVSTWQIKTAGGNTATFPPFTYTSTMASTPTQIPIGALATSPYYGLIFGVMDPSSHYTPRSLQLPIGSPLTNAGGTMSIDTTSSSAYECNGCSYPQRTIAAGIAPNLPSLVSITGTAPSITSGNTATFSPGTSGTFTVTTSGNPTPTLVESGTLPPGVTFTDNSDGTATLTGTPAIGSSGAYPIMLTASNGATPDATQNFTLNVTGPPSITSANATTFTVGMAGSFTVTTSGVPAPTLTLTNASPALPSQVTFTDNGNGTATLAGTPPAGSGGVYTFTLTAHNTSSPDATQSFTLTVNQVPAWSNPNGCDAGLLVGNTFSYNVDATGVPIPTLSESGTLPPGVTYTDNGDGSATVAGTPTQAGVYTITQTASNGVSPNATQTCTMSVSQAPTITSAGATTFTLGVPGTFTVTATGTPTPAFQTSGALPAGVTFTDNGNGTATLSGTSTATGTFVLSIIANNGYQPQATQTFTLTVAVRAAAAPAPALDIAGLSALLTSLALGAYFGLRRKPAA